MKETGKIGIDNIQRIQFDKLEKNFSFIVNGKIYPTNSIVANILSPNISKIFQKNMNISFYEMKTKYEGDFNRIIEYGEMKTINIQKKENEYFLNVLKDLGNKDEAYRFFKKKYENISYKNVSQRIKDKKEFDMNFDKEINFISRHFHEIHINYPNIIFSLDQDAIERIISNNKLKLQDENELFDIVLELYIKSKKYSTLFSYIEFMNLSTQRIQKFQETFDLNDINSFIWKKICYRLEQDISTESKTEYFKLNHEFLENRYKSIRYENIIEHLNQKYHCNVHSQNIIQITSSSRFSEEYQLSNIIEKNDAKFGTRSESNSWIQFDFKERKVLLDSYTIKTVKQAHLKNWIVEVSNDGKNYEEIDRHENCDLLKCPFKAIKFKVSCSCSKPQRFVRLKQIGVNWQYDNELWLTQIDFSGFLYE